MIGYQITRYYKEYFKYELCLAYKVKLFVKRLVYMYTITRENNITTNFFYICF